MRRMLIQASHGSQACPLPQSRDNATVSTVSPHLVLRAQPDGAQRDGLQTGGGEKERERAAGHTLLNPLRAALCFQRLNLNEEQDMGLFPPLCSHSQGIWKSGRLTGKSPYDPNVIQDPRPDSAEKPPIISTGVSMATK